MKVVPSGKPMTAMTLPWAQVRLKRTRSIKRAILLAKLRVIKDGTSPTYQFLSTIRTNKFTISTTYSMKLKEW